MWELEIHYSTGERPVLGFWFTDCRAVEIVLEEFREKSGRWKISGNHLTFDQIRGSSCTPPMIDSISLFFILHSLFRISLDCVTKFTRLPKKRS